MIKVNRYNSERTHAQRVNEIQKEIDAKVNREELTEDEIKKGVSFDKVLKKVDPIDAEINKIEENMTIIRLSQMSIEYSLKRMKILTDEMRKQNQINGNR